MNRDVYESVSELEKRREADRVTRNDFSKLWHRLRAYRDGLRQEIRERAPSRLQEDHEVIYEEMISKGVDTLQVATVIAKEASDALNRHLSGVSTIGRLSSNWRAERVSLEADVADKHGRLNSLSVFREDTKKGARRWSLNKVQENRLANERNFQPIMPLVSRLEGIDNALAAIDAGDQKVMACLQRWDIDALIKVAFLWGKYRDWGSLSDVDSLYYSSAGIPNITPTEKETLSGTTAISDEGDFIRMTLSERGTLSGIIKNDYGGFLAGTVLDGLTIIKLAGLLGNLRLDNLHFDGDLLETYLDAKFQAWREIVAADMRAKGEDTSRVTPAPEAESPYDILGVTSDMSLAEISKIFAMTMNAVQNLPNAAPQRRLIAAFKDIRKLKETATPGNGP